MGRNNQIIPCKDCLIFPLCKNKPMLSCELLTMYVCPVINSFVGHDQGVQDRLMVVTKLFDKMANLHIDAKDGKTIEFARFQFHETINIATVA